MLDNKDQSYELVILIARNPLVTHEFRTPRVGNVASMIEFCERISIVRVSFKIYKYIETHWVYINGRIYIMSLILVIIMYK